MRRSSTIIAKHWQLGEHILYCEDAGELLFTENETNFERVFGARSRTPYVKDAFHRYVVDGEGGAVNLASIGTKAAAWYDRTIGAGETMLLGSAAASLCAWWALGFVMRLLQRGGKRRGA